mmetsp:Transcript_79661/g.110687  ORF Transcript_79661/g.110687 Transcript_79661/m.110687 type:complete len:237 (+) Transcript_79661:102-812(+)
MVDHHSNILNSWPRLRREWSDKVERLTVGICKNTTTCTKVDVNHLKLGCIRSVWQYSCGSHQRLGDNLQICWNPSAPVMTRVFRRVHQKLDNTEAFVPRGCRRAAGDVDIPRCSWVLLDIRNVAMSTRVSCVAVVRVLQMQSIGVVEMNVDRQWDRWVAVDGGDRWYSVIDRRVVKHDLSRDVRSTLGNRPLVRVVQAAATQIWKTNQTNTMHRVRDSFLSQLDSSPACGIRRSEA